ncbi:hypothetical protein G6F66_015451 [Rhizopus arrhizus]|nr:hypothetical protein G6F66_015451 [Rhizopus arrhizus]
MAASTGTTHCSGEIIPAATRVATEAAAAWVSIRPPSNAPIAMPREPIHEFSAAVPSNTPAAISASIPAVRSLNGRPVTIEVQSVWRITLNRNSRP